MKQNEGEGEEEEEAAGWIEETKRCGEQSGEEWLRGMERLGMGTRERERDESGCRSCG